MMHDGYIEQLRMIIILTFSEPIVFFNMPFKRRYKGQRAAQSAVVTKLSECKS